MKLFIKENQEASNKVVLIISAEYYKLHHTENQLRTVLFERELVNLGVPFTRALGCYKGTEEVSFVITPRNTVETLDLIDTALGKLNQESVLVRVGNKVLLKSLDGNDTIGSKLVAVSKEQAMKCDAYTIVKDSYFIVK